MINFFRKIRQRLLTENLTTGQAGKSSKYLFYAIGEVLLVVIGILIALQINNWNEESKDKTRLQSHYKELKEELSYDLIQIEQHLKNLDSIDNHGLHIRAFLNKELTPIDTTQLKRAFLSAGFYVVFDASSVAYDNLVSSGDINMMTNNNLKRKLGDFHNPGGWDKAVNIGYVRQSIEEYHHYRHYFIEPTMDRVFHINEVLAASLPDLFNRADKSLADFSVNWQMLLTDKEYSVKLDKLHTARLNQKLLYYILRKDMKHMLKMLDTELNKE